MPIEKPSHPSDKELSTERKTADERISKQRGGADEHAPKPKKS